MRRIVLVLVLVVVLAVAGYMLLRPKGAARPRSAKAAVQQVTDDGTAAAQSVADKVTTGGKTSARTGRVAGKLKASTAQERREKAKQIRAEERRRKKELKRLEREKRRMLTRARSRRGRRTTRRGQTLYVLRAVVATGSESYAMVDGRRVQVGDFVLGRKIVGISPDRVEIEAFGRRSTVRVGESLLPAGVATSKRR